MKILLIEDDAPTAAVLSEVLTAQFYIVDTATDGQLGLSLAATGDYDLILLDLLVPKLDGISLCRRLRTQGFQKPILLLTAKDSSTDVVKGLDAGADDYVIKPYNLSELMARIRALLRRKEVSLTPSLLTWERLAVNPLSAEVTYADQKVLLTPKEYSLLGLFLQNPQRIFSRSSIIDRLWSIDASPSEGAVTNLIKDLRQKLKAAGMTLDLLETVHGLGYRLKVAPTTIQELNTTPVKKLEPSAQPGEQKRRGRPRKSMASVNKVIERYRGTFAERVAVLEKLEQAIHNNRLSPDLQRATAQEAHKLAGTLGSFGFETGSKLAREIEHLLLESSSLKTDVAHLTSLLTHLKESLGEPVTPITPAQLEPDQLPLVLVIDANESFTRQLQVDAFDWGLKVEIVTDLTIAHLEMSRCSPSAVLLNLSWPDQKETVLTLLQTIRHHFPELPVLVLNEQDNLIDRVTVSRLGVQRFLHQPLTPAIVFEATTQILSQSQATEARAMLLDDDPVVLTLLRELLEPWGLQVTTLQDPQQFWEVLVATNPDLLILDIEMPEFSGIDLCRVVRQDTRWGDLPILVVTAHTDMESIQQMFAAGADDFIGKPIVGPELVTRVISRIDRSRLQQQLRDMKRRIGE